VPLVLLFLLVPLPRQWGEYLQFGYDIFVNMPASWEVREVEERKFYASNQAEEAYLLLKYTEGSSFDDVEEMFSEYLRGLGGKVYEPVFFPLGAYGAALGVVDFSYGSVPCRGFLLGVESHRTDLAALAFSPLEDFAAYQDTLLSTLDSIALGEKGLMEPGPVSRALSPYPDGEREQYRLKFGGKEIPLSLSPQALTASQELIEREARVLLPYGGTEYVEAAWTRYYRMLYRDLYRRSRPIYSALRQQLSPEDHSDYEIAALLLAWVQDFTYERLDTLSDCLSPITAAVEHRGDCDSRGLLYSILLRYYGIDSVLMVSSVYGHSMVGVDVEGKGARFGHNGKNYLVAETTDRVEIGLIDRGMADPNNWLGIDFIHFWE
jgi:hypothetical protein